MELKDLYFNILREGIKELNEEKYQAERNGQTKALQSTLNDLEGLVENLSLGNVMLCNCGTEKHSEKKRRSDGWYCSKCNKKY